jgi:hypothetical protein
LVPRYPYLKLAPEQRADVLREVRAVLPDHVDIDTTVQVRAVGASEKFPGSAGLLSLLAQ